MGQSHPEAVSIIIEGCGKLSQALKDVDFQKGIFSYGQQLHDLSIFVKEADKHVKEFSPELLKIYNEMKLTLYNACTSTRDVNVEFRTTLENMKGELNFFKSQSDKTADLGVLFGSKISKYEQLFRSIAQKFENHKETLDTTGKECLKVAQKIEKEIPREKFGKSRAWSIVGIVSGCFGVALGVAGIIVGVISCYFLPPAAVALIGGGIASVVAGVGTIIPSGSKLDEINKMQNNTTNLAKNIDKTATCISEIVGQCKLLADASGNNGHVPEGSKWAAYLAAIELLLMLIKKSIENSDKLEKSVTNLFKSIL